jgi:hypothetical protein
MEAKIKRDTTVEEFSRIVEDESSKALALSASSIKKWTCKQDCPFVTDSERSLMRDCDTFTRIIVAGYESDAPVIYSIKFKTDWERNIATPVRIPELLDGVQTDSRAGGFGIYQSLIQACIPVSDAYKKAVAKIPCVCHARKSTLPEASDAVRGLIGIEAEANPNAVSVPITIVTIPKRGGGRIRTYKKVRGCQKTAENK